VVIGKYYAESSTREGPLKIQQKVKLKKVNSAFVLKSLPFVGVGYWGERFKPSNPPETEMLGGVLIQGRKNSESTPGKTTGKGGRHRIWPERKFFGRQKKGEWLLQKPQKILNGGESTEKECRIYRGSAKGGAPKRLKSTLGGRIFPTNYSRSGGNH